VSSLLKDDETNMQSLDSNTYTFVTINGLTITQPPTSAKSVILFNIIDVLPILLADILKPLILYPDS
jgi:hypothetical protein